MGRIHTHTHTHMVFRHCRLAEMRGHHDRQAPPPFSPVSCAFADEGKPVSRQLSRSYFVPRSLEGYERHLRQIHCEGYLQRQSRTSGTWRRRWFLLKVSTHRRRHRCLGPASLRGLFVVSVVLEGRRLVVCSTCWFSFSRLVGLGSVSFFFFFSVLPLFWLFFFERLDHF